jgi:ferredoxin
MQHLTTSNGYSLLMERLSRFPQGAPPSELLERILALLFTEKEAELVSRLPMSPFSAATAAHLWGMREVEAFRLLEGLADRVLLLDTERDGEKLYQLPPAIAGFFDFSLMRVRSDLDQKSLSELLFQYLNMEEDFITSLFVQGRTRLGRVMVGEDEIAPANVARVLNYERASEAIKGANRIALASCYCRHKMHHLGRACSAGMEMCMTFDTIADALIRHGHAREIDRSECLDLLQQAREQNLVQMAENSRQGVSFICNCCSCCCESMIAARKFSQLRPVHTSNFIANLRADLCSGCGRCVDACPVEAVSLVSANDAQHRWMRKCVPNPERCLGCGICVRVCKSRAQSLAPREERVITPADSAHRVVLMALESGKLQHLIWDNQALFSHRAMAAIVGAILKLEPVKQALAQSQLGSRYLHGMIQRQVDLAKAPIHRYDSVEQIPRRPG